ncbi:MAG: hypothetical protein AB7R90_15455 [Reyranellaceae bacterium]
MRIVALSLLAALAGVTAIGAGTAVAQTLAQNLAQKKVLTPAETKQKLAQWRAAFDCTTFHYNRLDRFTRQGNAQAAEQAEELWLDWDDLAIEVEEELDQPLHQEAAQSRAVEEAHQAQLTRLGWPGYEKAWMGKCGKSPY